MAAADAALDVSHWQQHGGTVLQTTASNGRIRRTFVAPSGEKFRTWKECLKYMGTTLNIKPLEDEEEQKPAHLKKRPPSANLDKKKVLNDSTHEVHADTKPETIQTAPDPSKKRKSQSENKGKQQQKTKKRPRDCESSDGEADGKGECPDADITDSSGDDKGLRRPKRAAAAKCFKEKCIKLDEKDAIIESKPERLVEGEEVAIVLTAGKGDEFEQPKRRLLEFIVHDEEGKPAAIEMIGIIPLFITGLVLPQQGNVDKELAVRCEGFAVDAWDIAGYVEGQAQVWLTTDMAEYLCVKPLGSYKKLYDQIFEKAMVCVEVYKALSKPDGGDPDLGFDDLFIKLSRTFASKGGQFFSKDYLASQGNFIVSHLIELDNDADDRDQLFTGLPALAALEKEHKKREESYQIVNASVKAGTLKIRDVNPYGSDQGTTDDSMDDDEKLARLLQEQEERKALGQNRRMQQQSTNKGKFYIKINEDEIANDYPAPAFYKAEEEEMDEYVLFDESTAVLAPEDLPRRMLHDWALYNCDSRLVSLELLPMLAGTEADVEVFGSGIMSEDDGSGYWLDDNAASGISTKQDADPPEGIRIYLSSVKEWVIEFGASMLFISIRTDGAWYRLGQPSQQYMRWYTPVLKTARLAIHIITMLKEEMRVSRLSFADVVKRIADVDIGQPTFISNKVFDVERYVVVHGQIILQQFAEYPDETIKRSAFVSGLTLLMEQKHHVKLVTSKRKLIRKGRNLNPRAGLRPDGTRPKPMRATTTKLINKIWSEYYSVNMPEGGETEEAAGEPTTEAEAVEQDEVLEASDNEDEKIVITGQKKKPTSKLRFNRGKKESKIAWLSKSSGKSSAHEPVYAKAQVGSDEVSVGGVVLVETEESSEEPEMVIVEYFYEKKNGTKFLHGRFLESGQQTVLGNAADPLSVYLTDRCVDVNLADIKSTVTVRMIKRAWGYATRKSNAVEDEEFRTRVSANEVGSPAEYYCKAMYCPEKGAFMSIPYNRLALGTGECYACKHRTENKERLSMRILAEDEGISYQGIEYRIKDFFYVNPDALPSLPDESDPVEKFKASRNRGLRAFVVCQLLSFKTEKGFKQLNAKNIRLSVRRFYRPEDVSSEKAYTADVREVYYSESIADITLDSVNGKCEVQGHSFSEDGSQQESFNHVFFCTCIFDPKKGTIKQLPANVKLSSLKSSSATSKGKSAADEIAIAKRKGKAIESEEPVQEQLPAQSLPSLASLDIFAGCGGLSEGLHQSGAALTKWAIEYEHPAAEAFKLNHPEAEVFCENCNVILRSIMEKGGDLDDCISTPEAESLSLKLSEEQKVKLPMPGEVDLIVGGPPCQGFSGMNRFNQRTWSKVQCEMILSFLSFADYFRPRFFLLENVRNFVSFNKGQTFRLTLASLIEMGYQVRFGVLQAGNYGVSQSRKRAFIWAASPEESLPDWPQARHVFASSQLDIVLPGGLQYAAVRNSGSGAPLRPITVRDTIADLPPVGNGADKTEISYGNSPESWFQKFIRGQENHLYDHISKEMNELNHIRCQRIPKRPGADWRDLPEEKVKLSTGQLVDLIPWCLPNTAERHNQWKGLYGRLDWEGNFPTSVTDPQPMGKVGMCFHPEQDRIVTVRECARSQGFPDSYKFYGNIQCKHRQIGNAVPPPLARALGDKLKEVAERGQDSS